MLPNAENNFNDDIFRFYDHTIFFLLFYFNLQILELILMKIEIERDKKHPESRREKKGS